MLIYNYSGINNYFTGQIRNIADDAGIPVLWTDEPMPSIPEGNWARYNNPGWVVTDVPPPIPSVEEPAVQAQAAPTQPGEAPTVI
jgi:hypothetical protein